VNDGPLRAALLGTAVVLAAFAVFAGDNSDAAVPLATGAALAIVGFAVLSMASNTRYTPRPLVPLVADPFVALRNAFREGALGRERVAVAIAELERAAHGRPPITDDERSRLRPEERRPEQFRQWVSERLDELERST
jgi:hypothetical protein